MSRSLAAALLLLSLAPARADVPPLQPKGYTSDFAGVLSAAGIARVDSLAGEVERKTGAQIAVVMVRTLDGEPIENYANTLARRWGIGRKDNRGILLLIAVDDRRNRLEVGYGLEPILPDGRVGGILRSLRPHLRQGDYDGAVWLAVGQVAAVIAEASGVTLEGQTLPRPPPRERREDQLDLPVWLIFLGIVGVIWLVAKTGVLPWLLLSGMGGPRRRRGGWHGGWFAGGGGRGGGAGWDGGGFSGFGGGDFGGGGASSDW